MAMVHWMAIQIDFYLIYPNGGLISRSNYLYGFPAVMIYGI